MTLIVQVGQVPREVLLAPTATLRVGQVPREVMLAPTAILRVGQIVREVLLTTKGASPPPTGQSQMFLPCGLI